MKRFCLKLEAYFITSVDLGENTIGVYLLLYFELLDFLVIEVVCLLTVSSSFTTGLKQKRKRC